MVVDQIKKAVGFNDFEIWLSNYVDRLEDDYYDSMKKGLDVEIVYYKYSKLKQTKIIRDAYYDLKK